MSCAFDDLSAIGLAINAIIDWSDLEISSDYWI